MTAVSLGATPTSAIALWSTLRMAWSPHPGHQRAVCSFLKSPAAKVFVMFSSIRLCFCYVFFNSIYNLLHEEGLSFHFVDAENLFARDVLLQIVGKHAGVKLCHDDSLEFLELVDSVFGSGLM